MVVFTEERAFEPFGKSSKMQVADDKGEKPRIWEEYVICIERKLAAAYEKSLTASLRFLISLISGFRAREGNIVSRLIFTGMSASPAKARITE